MSLTVTMGRKDPENLCIDKGWCLSNKIWSSVFVENEITSFKEKPQTNQGWINGGFFVIEPGFFDLIDGDETILEKEPLEKACELNELMAYKHEGFWQCMDTKRDWQILEDHCKASKIPWLIK